MLSVENLENTVLITKRKRDCPQSLLHSSLFSLLRSAHSWPLCLAHEPASCSSSLLRLHFPATLLPQGSLSILSLSSPCATFEMLLWCLEAAAFGIMVVQWLCKKQEREPSWHARSVFCHEVSVAMLIMQHEALTRCQVNAMSTAMP